MKWGGGGRGRYPVAMGDSESVAMRQRGCTVLPPYTHKLIKSIQKPPTSKNGKYKSNNTYTSLQRICICTNCRNSYFFKFVFVRIVVIPIFSVASLTTVGHLFTHSPILIVLTTSWDDKPLHWLLPSSMLLSNALSGVRYTLYKQQNRWTLRG